MRTRTDVRTGVLRLVSILPALLLGIASLSCGGKQQGLEPATETALQTGQPLEGIPGWPSAVPIDKVQPWEQLDGNGQVIPAQRTASAINQQSEFIPGVERFTSSGNVTDNGEASRIASTAGTSAQATFRIQLAGGHPGVVSVDANLLAGKGYYLGLADYGSGRWQWHGPFTDNHVRISTALQGPYTSSLGNLFISVLVHGGTAADIVGIGMNPEDPADSSAPPQPSGLSATALNGTLLLDWDSVIAGDLAGYRIYHSGAEFTSGDEAGVLRLDSLEGFNQHLLALPSGNAAYVRVSAVDISGNESPLSEIASAVPLAGTPPQLAINVDKPSGMLSESVSLTASGAELYDFDLDGDGIYDITGSSSGSAQVDTTSLGIIRPRVRGTGPEGTAVALGAVSLVVTGNSRPVAVASSDLSSGAAPLDVSFSGSESTDFDGSVVGGGWDFDGDGTYDVWDDTDIVHVTSAMHTYSAAGVYNAKLRVLDDQGAWDVDTVTIVVTPEPDPDNIDPSAHLSVDPTYGDTGVLVTLDASSSADLDGSIVLYEYDFNGDGLYDGSGAVSSISRKYDEMGVFNVGVRVTDDNGAQDTATASLRINEVPSLHTSWPGLGRDNRNTRRSPYNGAQTNSVKWAFSPGGSVSSSPAIGSDGTIYVGSANHRINAINPDGTLKWYYTTPEGFYSSPAIGDDGKIYIGGAAFHNVIYCFSPGGQLLWNFTTGGHVESSPAIAPDGTVYIGSDDDNLYALNANGTLKWTFEAGGNVQSSAAIGADGTVYVGSHANKLYAINPDGTQQWAFDTGNSIYGSPAIGPDGTVYFGCLDWKLYAVNPDGTEAWSYLTGENIQSSPAIAVDGTVYIGSADGSLHAVNPDGSGKWTYATGLVVDSSPAIGADGTVYVGGWDDKVHAINPDGSLKWEYLTGNNVRSSPAIGADGTVYIGSVDSRLYAFGAPQGNLPPVADLQADAYSGNEPLTVNFSALDSSDPDGSIVDYEWDFNGDLLFGDPGDETFNRGEAAPQVDFSAGIYVCSVRVTDDQGATAIATVTITSHGDADYTVDPDDFVGYDCSMAIVAGLPAIAYYDDANGGLRYARAQNEQGSSRSVQTIDSSGSTGHNPSLAVIDGRPAIAYADFSAPSLSYVRSNDGVGNSWGSIVTVDAGNTGYSADLLVVGGFPAIAYMYNTDKDVMYVRATDAQGGGWGTPVTVYAPGTNGSYLSAEVVAGNPAIAYYEDDNDNLMYVRATDTLGSSWPVPTTLDGTDMVGKHCSMAIVNGNPAIAYYDETNQDLNYIRATSNTGSIWGMISVIGGASQIGTEASLAVIAGRPAIACHKLVDFDLMYVRSNDNIGNSWPTPTAIATSDSSGESTSLLEYQDDPAIAYRITGATPYLRYIRLY